LSDTIDVAILDLWYRNREHFAGDDGVIDADWFANIFIDEYYKEGSKVDVWPEGALEAAKMRIAAAKSKDENSPKP